jgi:hypothetical protein
MNGFPYRTVCIIIPVMAVISILILIRFTKFIISIMDIGMNRHCFDHNR